MTEPLPDVQSAIAAVREQFDGHPVETIPDGSGGIFVIVSDVEIGPAYEPQTTWLGFQINAAYPTSDVYPHYIGRVQRHDGRAHGEGVQPVDWQGRQALQLSRRSNGWNPKVDNAVLKAEKVILWFSTL